LRRPAALDAGRRLVATPEAMARTDTTVSLASTADPLPDYYRTRRQRCAMPGRQANGIQVLRTNAPKIPASLVLK
jgi:hypothetical protein